MSDSPNPRVVAEILLRVAEWKAEQKKKAEFPLSEEEVQALGADRMAILHPLREVVVVEEGVVLS